MSKILIVAEHLNGALNASTARCVSCAQAIGGDIHVLVLSDAPDAVAAQAAQIAGVTKVLTVNNAANNHALAATLAPQVVELAKGYSHVLFPGTTFGKDLAPRVAAQRPARAGGRGPRLVGRRVGRVGPHALLEKLEVDPNWAARTGYDAGFLDEAGHLHVTGPEFWFVLEGKMESTIGSVPTFVAALAVKDGLMKKGVSLGCAHYAVEVTPERGGTEWKEWKN